jgi:ribonuclease P protein component
MRRAFFMRYSFPKKEHLTKKEHFDGLHAGGRGVKAFPFSLRYMEAELEDGIQRKVAIVAPKRGLKKAVERNKMKRQMRELYRLNKDNVFDSGVAEIWSIRYLGNRPNDYAFLEAGYLKLLEAYEEQRKKELADEK